MIDMVESFSLEKSFDKIVYSLSITNANANKKFRSSSSSPKGSREVIGLLIYTMKYLQWKFSVERSCRHGNEKLLCDLNN